MSGGRRVAPVEDVPDDTTLVFRIRNGDGEESEAILVRDDGGIEAWRNQCQHFRHVPLDKGDGATMRGDEIVCANHGAMFEAGSGRCTFGPCVGATLDPVDVTVKDGDVVLVDPDYEFVGTGPIEEDPTDLSSTSNVEF